MKQNEKIINNSSDPKGRISQESHRQVAETLKIQKGKN
jgi:hypothetical protein